MHFILYEGRASMAVYTSANLGVITMIGNMRPRASVLYCIRTILGMIYVIHNVHVALLSALSF